MENLQDPRLKKTPFLLATIAEMLAIFLIVLAFSQGVGWLVIVLQVWITVVFVVGVMHVPFDTKFVRNRLRWEQVHIYPVANAALFYIMSSNAVFSIMWVIAAIILESKYMNAITKIDREYSLKKYKERLYGLGDNTWTT